MILVDNKFWASEAMANTLDVLGTLRNGGIGTVKGYKPTSNYVQSPTVNVQFISKFSTERLYQRKLQALQAIDFATVSAKIAKEPKFEGKNVAAMFDAAKADLIASLEKTLAGNRSDGHRQGHDRCYAHTSQGIKVNLDCEKVDGIMVPKLVDGFPVAESVMVMHIELNRTTIVEGVRKLVNSRAETIMKGIVESAMNRRSVGIKAFSLKADNFDAIIIDRQTIEPQDIYADGLTDIIMEAVREAA